MAAATERCQRRGQRLEHMVLESKENLFVAKNTFHLVSLGCAKNTVDSDSMAQLLLRDGYHAVEDPSRANVLIVNTCGFIGPAKEESINVLRELAEGKR